MLSITRINTIQTGQPHIAKKEKKASSQEVSLKPYLKAPLNAFKSNAVSFGESKKPQEEGEKFDIEDIEGLDGWGATVATEGMLEYVKGSFINMHDSQGTLLEYQMEDIRPELFIDNVQFAFEHDLVKNLGFSKDTHYLVVMDSNDYNLKVDSDPFEKTQKNLNKFIEENKDKPEYKGKEPILILKNFDALVQAHPEIPLEAINHKFLKEHNYIALGKELSEDFKENYDFNYADYSKQLNSVVMDTIDMGDMRILLGKDAFIQKYIANGEDISISDEAIYSAQEIVDVKNMYQHNLSEVDIFKKIVTLKKLQGQKLDTITATDVDEIYENFVFDETEDISPSGSDTVSASGDKIKTPLSVLKNVKTRFNDVGGMFNIKKEIKYDFLDIINNSDVPLKYVPSGMILHGPPGTGKTLLARAIAGEAGLPLVSMSGSGFNEQFIGVGAARVRELFKVARKEARLHPRKMAIIFIDEIDAVAKERGKHGNDENDNTLNALLEEMDGIKSKDNAKEKVIVIAATNRKDILDGASIRQGRFDLEYLIEDPRYSKKARKEIIKIHSKDLKFKNESEKKKILDHFAQTSRGMSGAEIAGVLKSAFRMSLRKNRNENVNLDDINEAKLRIIAGVKTDAEEPTFEVESTILHEAGHGILSVVMNDVYKLSNPRIKPRHELDFITNEGRGKYAGAMYEKDTDTTHWTFESVLADLAVSYAGGSVEDIILEGKASGCESDLKQASLTIKNAVERFGLGPNTGRKGLEGASKTILRANEKNIKKDSDLMYKLGEEISNDVVKFTKGFLEFYIKEFRENPKMRSELITGEKFKKMFSTWVNKENKKEEYKAFCEGIYEKIQYAKENGEMKSKFNSDYVINNPFYYSSSTSYS